MFIKNLYRFQEKHEESLLRMCAGHKEMVLSAPTGSGKTILASKFICDYFEEHPNTVFLWLCPGAGGLEKQSQESFEESTSEIATGDVYDFITEFDCRGRVYFINWDKINKSSNLALKEGEQKEFRERVDICKNDRIEIFVVVDEEQRFHDAAERFINNVNPGHVLRISATPLTNNAYTEVITDEEVIAEGLITSTISVNEDVSDEMEKDANAAYDLELIRLADKKRKEIQAAYDAKGINVRPLVLIQFPNGTPEWIERVKEYLTSLGYGEQSGLTTSWFSGEHPEHVDELKKLNGHYSFLLFKQAINTGWDCPRAKILVKLREGGSEAFNIQTIGRIRRMPERHHYDDELLDRCYVYTLDEEFKKGLTQSLNDSFYTFLYKKKKEAPSIILSKEYLDGADKRTVNSESVVKAIYKKFYEKYDTNGDGVVTKQELKTNFGYVFGTLLQIHAFEGVARTANDMAELDSRFTVDHEISTHDDGPISRDAKRKIARALSIDEITSNNALRILFGPYDKFLSVYSEEEIAFEHKYKIFDDLDLREFNAFLINNKERLIDLFSEINASEIAEIEEVPIATLNWDVPKAQYYKMHKRIGGNWTYNHNMFIGYKDNITLDPNRSHTERLLELYCESENSSVEWIYKNGDKGLQYFSIVYRMPFKRANFYPDYIIKTKSGEIWIIEAKGGVSADGESRNIDNYARNKFEATKEYAQRYPEIKWGFVRAVGNSLYLSNTEWTEDMYNQKIWRPIEEFF